MSEPLKCYWWSHPCKAGVYNFEDLLTPMLLKYYKASHCIRPVSSPADADLLVVGSILQGVPEQNSPIILGAGSLTDKTLNIPKAKVYALRGLLTKERLGITDDVVVGDPGLLISRILPVTQLALDAKAEDMKPIGIVPHWKHYASPRLARYRLDSRFKFINPRCKPEQVAKEICSCSSIIASSLHALIVADAYGVPNVRLNFNDGLRDVCDFKYEDYYSAIARTGFAARSITPEEISADLLFDTDYQKNVARVQDNLDNVFRRFYTEQCALQPSDDTKIRSISAPKVSVIVPVYKAKEYIGDLLESLLNQTLREMEFIFVDDKGGDGTFDIVREAAKRDNRIVCLENAENRGPGYSRNRGIKAARGEYIAFADADDFVTLDFYEVLYADAVLHRALVVKGGCRHVYDEGAIKESQLNVGIRKKNSTALTLLNAFTTEHWSAVYSRKFVLDVGARYDESSHYGEDTYFLMSLMYHLKYDDFSISDQVIYFYRQQVDSLMHCRKNSAYFKQMVRRGQARLEWIYAHPDTPELTEYTANVFEGQLGWILDGALCDDARKEDIISYLQFCLDALEGWKASERVYKPGILASALIELKHCPYHFCSLRKVYQRLAQLSREQNSLHGCITQIQRDIQQVAANQTVHAWQQAIEQRFCKPLDVQEGLLERICRFRVEVYREGGCEGCFTLSGMEELQVSSPSWLCRGGYGVMLVGRTGAYALRVAVGESGRLTLRFRGVDVRDGEKRVPAWVDISSLRIDGREYEARAVWHDKAYTVTLDVLQGHLVTIELTAEPHLHTEPEAERLLQAFYPKLEYTFDAKKILLGHFQSRVAALRGVSLPSLQAASSDSLTQMSVLRSNHEALQQKHLTLQDAYECLKKATAESDKRLSAQLSDMGKTLVDQSATIARQASTIEAQKSDIIALSTHLRESDQVLTATRKQLAIAERIQQLSILMSRLRWRYQLLRFKKTFSFGKRRERYKQKIKAIKPLIREYKDLVRGMRDMS